MGALLAAPAMTVNGPGGDPAAQGGGTDWIGDVMKGAKDAAEYLLRGELAKIANKRDLPNSPKNVEATAWKWVVGLAIVGVVAYVVVKGAKGR